MNEDTRAALGDVLDLALDCPIALEKWDRFEFEEESKPDRFGAIHSRTTGWVQVTLEMRWRQFHPSCGVDVPSDWIEGWHRARQRLRDAASRDPNVLVEFGPKGHAGSTKQGPLFRIWLRYFDAKFQEPWPTRHLVGATP